MGSLSVSLFFKSLLVFALFATKARGMEMDELSKFMLLIFLISCGPTALIGGWLFFYMMNP